MMDPNQHCKFLASEPYKLWYNFGNPGHGQVFSNSNLSVQNRVQSKLVFFDSGLPESNSRYSVHPRSIFYNSCHLYKMGFGIDLRIFCDFLFSGSTSGVPEANTRYQYISTSRKVVDVFTTTNERRSKKHGKHTLRHK